VEYGALKLVRIGLADIIARCPQFEKIIDFPVVQALLIVDITVGTADGNP